MYSNYSKSVYTISSNTKKLAILAKLRFTQFVQVSFVQQTDNRLQHFAHFVSDYSMVIR